MARYICSFTVSSALDSLAIILTEILQSCRFNVIHQAGDYWMAQEIPGRVSYVQLVTVEILFDVSLKSATAAATTTTRVNCVVKNEELPLNLDNHCRQMFDQLSAAIVNSDRWQLLEHVTS